MTEEFTIVSILSIPLFVLTVLPLGWLKSRLGYLISAVTVSIASGGLILAGEIAAATAPDCGIGGKPEGMPLWLLWAIITVALFWIGYGSRPKRTKQL